MIDFFINNPLDITYSKKIYPRWDWIKRSYVDSIDNLVAYYNSKNVPVNNSHLLVRIIKQAYQDININIADYFKNIETTVKYVAKHFKLVNNISTGAIYGDIFYYSNSYEIICHVEQDYDIFHVENNYALYSPLRVVYTEETALDFHLLNGTKTKPHPQLTVLELDITLMMVMYRSWAKRRIKFGLGADPRVFVSNIVIPNTIKTMVDLVIFNRYIGMIKGTPLSEHRVKHKVYVIDYSRGVDDTLRRVAEDMVNTKTPLLQFINNIPTIYYKDMFSALRLGRSVYTRQSLWTLWMARIKYMSNILDILGTNGINANRKYTSLIHYDVREIKNGCTPYKDFLRKVKDIEEEYMGLLDKIDRQAK